MAGQAISAGVTHLYPQSNFTAVSLKTLPEVIANYFVIRPLEVFYIWHFDVDDAVLGVVNVIVGAVESTTYPVFDVVVEFPLSSSASM